MSFPIIVPHFSKLYNGYFVNIFANLSFFSETPQKGREKGEKNVGTVAFLKALCYTIIRSKQRKRTESYMKQPYLEAGKIINIHGFRGAVKLESWCDSPGVLAELKTLWFRNGDSYFARRVLHASVFRQFVIAQLEGISGEEEANRLRGTVVYAAREDLPLPEGGSFIADLIGLPIKHADTGEVLGELVRIDSRGHGDLYTVKTPRGEELFPAVAPFLIRIDVEDGIYVRPIPGLLDGGAEQV